jgi:hypothetical protein
MQVPNQFQFLESQLLAGSLNPFQKLVPQRPDVVSLVFGLQQTVAKQQMLLKLLMLQNQVPQNCFPQVEQNLLFSQPQNLLSLERPSVLFPKSLHPFQAKEDMMVKLESAEGKFFADDLCAQSIQGSEGSTSMEESGSDEEESIKKRDFKIIRRNGFKPQRKFKEEETSDSGEEYPRKSNKMIIPKRPPSKAKHLWINYGRKIIEFAVNHTKDDVQNQIKQLIGKLSSKKDFEDVFGVKPDDSESDKAFKVLFGKLALYFVKFKADAAFEGSKYKDQMITQKTIIASWISKLINEQI